MVLKESRFKNTSKLNINSAKVKDLKLCLEKLWSVNTEYIEFRIIRKIPKNKHLRFPHFENSELKTKRSSSGRNTSGLRSRAKRKSSKRGSKEDTVVNIYLNLEENRLVEGNSEKSDLMRVQQIPNEGSLKRQLKILSQEKKEVTVEENRRGVLDVVRELRKNETQQFDIIEEMRPAGRESGEVERVKSERRISSVETTKRNKSNKDSQIFQESNNTNGQMMKIDSPERNQECLLKRRGIKAWNQRNFDQSEEKQTGEVFRKILDQSLIESGLSKILENKGLTRSYPDYLEGLEKFRNDISLLIVNLKREISKLLFVWILFLYMQFLHGHC